MGIRLSGQHRSVAGILRDVSPGGVRVFIPRQGAHSAALPDEATARSFPLRAEVPALGSFSILPVWCRRGLSRDHWVGARVLGSVFPEPFPSSGEQGMLGPISLAGMLARLALLRHLDGDHVASAQLVQRSMDTAVEVLLQALRAFDRPGSGEREARTDDRDGGTVGSRAFLSVGDGLIRLGGWAGNDQVALTGWALRAMAHLHSGSADEMEPEVESYRVASESLGDSARWLGEALRALAKLEADRSLGSERFALSLLQQKEHTLKEHAPGSFPARSLIHAARRALAWRLAAPG